MDGIICDRCGRDLLGQDIRYTMRMEIKSAYDVMEITSNDLCRDIDREIRNLVNQLDNMDTREAEDQVYAEINFDLCISCQRDILKNPLGKDINSGIEDRED